MKMKSLLVLVLTGMLFSACSHKEAKPDYDQSPATDAEASATPSPDLSLPMCDGKACTGTGAYEYLNTIALPRIIKSKAVQECYIKNPKATPKELASGYLTFHFEIKLLADGDHVKVGHVYLSSYINVPEWTKPCLIDKYKEMTFPKFSDPDLKTAKAFGTVEMTWDPKTRKVN
jgi:hypothetical protein